MTLEEIKNFEFNNPDISISLAIYDRRLQKDGCGSLNKDGGLSIFVGAEDGSDDYYIPPNHEDLENNRIFLKSINDGEDNVLLEVNEYITF